MRFPHDASLNAATTHVDRSRLLGYPNARLRLLRFATGFLMRFRTSGFLLDNSESRTDVS